MIITLLLYLGLLTTLVLSSKLDPIDQFSKYTVIRPNYYDQDRHLLNTSASRFDCEQISFIELIDEQFNINLFTFRVFKNSQFIANHFHQKYQLNGSLIDHVQVSKDECFFRGYITNQKLFSNITLPSTETVALNLFRKNELNGYFYLDDKLFHLHFHLNLSKEILFDDQHSLPLVNEYRCGYNANKPNPLNDHHRINKRDTQKIHGIYQQNSQTRFVELLIVNDHKLFLEYNRDKERLINRSKQIANIVNTVSELHFDSKIYEYWSVDPPTALYNQLNIFIILVGVIVWTEEDDIEITQNGDETLNRFLRYRKDKLLPQIYNDNAQLLTSMTFKDNVVGKALKGPICTEDFSGGVNSDHNKLIDVVATTVAHELFHNFGGEHDPTDSKDNRICSCPQSKCIMSPSSGSLTPRFWSNCSIESFKEIYQHGMESCLRNLPKETLSFTCGNGILEGNEECDTKTETTCCIARTCKLKVNATCATGNCCDMDTCQLVKERQKICRPSTDFCDLPEHCDGESEFCPSDVYAHNGLKCTVDGDESYCFDGKCHSLKSQCKLLYGNEAIVAIDRCYQENANNASQAANCGYEITKYNEKRFKACKKPDIFCGRLHCLHNNKLVYGLDSASNQSLISRNNKTICQTAIIDLGVGIDDPGLVRNGVKCGQNRMCLNQRCVPVPSSFCSYDCNHNGICNSLGKCHCFDGFYPPYCHKYSLLFWFLFILFLFSSIGAAFYLVYHYRERIQTWWIVKQRTAAIKKRAKNTNFKLDKSKLMMRNRQNTNINFDLKNLEISSPIPMNDVNKSTVDANSNQPLSTTVDYTTNENLNRLWETSSRAADSKESKLVPIRSNTIAPVRKAPPPPPANKSNSQQPSLSTERSAPAYQSKNQSSISNTNSLCNDTNVESNQVSKLKERFEI